MLLPIVALSFLPSIVSSVSVQSGTSGLQGASDTCQNRQEFSCLNNQCDPSSNAPGGGCRAGGSIKCLDSIVTAPGNHAMPDSSKGQGTDKHFTCVSVTSFDTPVVIWETTDCTGKSCFIPGEGSYATWALGAVGNCVEIAPQTPVNSTPCLSPGETGITPPGGGFLSSVSVPVGGDYGLPADFTNTKVCSTNLVDVNTIPGVSIIYPPDQDVSQAYIAPDADSNDGEVDKRTFTASGRINRRTDPRPKIVTAVAALKKFPYKRLYDSLPSPRYLLVTAQGTLATLTGAVTSSYNVDHIVEMETIVEYFTADWASTLGLSINQWDVVYGLFESQGITPILGGTCTPYLDLQTICSDPENLLGVDNAVNKLKNVVFAAVLPTLLPGTGIPRASPVWTSWTRTTATATLAYLRLVQPRVGGISASIGNLLDTLILTTGAHVLQNDFSSFTSALWSGAETYLENALQQPQGYFKGE